MFIYLNIQGIKLLFVPLDKASRDDHSIYGTPLKVIKNNSLWHDGVLALEYKFFIEAYTQETHPEYYL